MIRIGAPMIGLLLIGALLGVGGTGCSSSQETAAAALPAKASNQVSADPQVNAIIARSCYTCHSTGGAAPWYAAVSPTYMASNSARGVLNFSDWQTYDTEKKAAA